jgi:hypothetical protein
MPISSSGVVVVAPLSSSSRRFVSRVILFEKTSCLSLLIMYITHIIFIATL